MVIFNVTTQSAWSIYTEWIAWLKLEHLPAIEQMGIFDRCQAVRLLDINEDEGPTYAIQYYASDGKRIEELRCTFFAVIQKEQIARWGNNISMYCSLMEVIN